jgi:hypothetical protein
VVAAMAGLCPCYLEFATPDQTEEFVARKKQMMPSFSS